MAERARTDADRAARPRARLVGHVRLGDCVGPGVLADAYEAEDGTRIPLRAEPAAEERLTGRRVRAEFKDGTVLTGRVLRADGGLGSVTIAWTDGPREMSCSFRTHDALSVRIEPEGP